MRKSWMQIYNIGFVDGQTAAYEPGFSAEYLTATGWDATLVNAIGSTDTADLLGVDPNTPEWDAALGVYNLGAYHGAVDAVKEKTEAESATSPKKNWHPAIPKRMRLAETAVAACYAANPKDPQAVADNIGLVLDTVKQAVTFVDYYSPELKITGWYRIFTDLLNAIDAVDAKTEGVCCLGCGEALPDSNYCFCAICLVKSIQI